MQELKSFISALPCFLLTLYRPKRILEKVIETQSLTNLIARAVEPELKISGCGSRHLDFLAPDPEQFGWLKTKIHCSNVKTRFPHKYVCGTGTQISGSGCTIKHFWLRLQPSKIAWFPAPGSTALLIGLTTKMAKTLEMYEKHLRWAKWGSREARSHSQCSSSEMHWCPLYNTTMSFQSCAVCYANLLLTKPWISVAVSGCDICAEKTITEDVLFL